MQRAERWMAAGLAIGLGAFALLAFDLKVTKVLPELDVRVYEGVAKWESSGAPAVALGNALSLIGDWRTLTVAVAATVAWMLWRREVEMAAWCVAIAVASSVALSLLKAIFERGRPPLVAELDLQLGPSFPSGHTFGAASALGAAILLATEVHTRVVHARARQTLHFWAFGLVAWGLLTFLTGIGRVLARRHWMSDVLASWALGLALVAGLLLVLSRRRAGERLHVPEPPKPGTDPPVLAEPPS